MNLEAKLPPLLDAIYDAAVEASRWPSALRRIGDVLDSRTTALIIHDADFPAMSCADASAIASPYERTIPGGFLTVEGLDSASLDRYVDHFATVDPLTPRCASLSEGRVASSDSLIADPELERTEFHADYLRPLELHYGFGAAVLRRPGLHASLTGLTSSRVGPYEPRRLELLETLTPHLRRALNASRGLGALHGESQAAYELLDGLATGVLLVDRHGRVVRANREADRLLRLCDGLASTRDGLVAGGPAQTSMLRQLVASACETPNDTPPCGGEALSVRRPSGRPPYRILVTPIRAQTAERWNAHALAAVLISDGQARVDLQVDALRGLYGFTRAEARVARLLALGHTLEQVAASRGTTLHTARGQLKHILSKTGCSRQAELVRLLVTGPAALAACTAD